MNKKPNSLEFARAYLRRSPKATFAQIRDAAAKKKIKLLGISFGRAQYLEGVVKPKKSKSVNKKKAVGNTAGKKRGPGRPKGSKNRPTKTTDLGSLNAIIETMQKLQKERNEARRTLEKIAELLG